MPLTSEQITQFNDNGCVSRCLLLVANTRRPQPLTIEEYVNMFLPDYPALWATQCGAVEAGMLLPIAKALNLGSRFQISLRMPHVIEAWDQHLTNTVLLITELKVIPPDPVPRDFMHCRFVSRMGPGLPLRAAEANNQLRPEDPVEITDALLSSLGGYFCVFQN